MGNKDKLYGFLENWLIRIIIMSIGVVLSINHLILSSPYLSYGITFLDKFIAGSVALSINSTQGTLLTIAAIFVGFYFTVFTLLGSIRIDSTFATLSQSNFDKLVRFIKQAFIASFIYIFINLTNTIILATKNVIPLWIVILTLLSTLYMFLTSLRFGIVIYLAFQRDFSKMQEGILKEKKKKNDLERVLNRLDEYLHDIESDKARIQAEKISKFIDKKNKPT
jgi:hypothetical protein